MYFHIIDIHGWFKGDWLGKTFHDGIFNFWSQLGLAVLR